MSETLREALLRHRWHVAVWSGGGWAWKCSCGIHDWGTAVENPSRYVRHPTREAACEAAVDHVLAATAPTPDEVSVTCADLGCVDGRTVQGRKYHYDDSVEEQWAPCARQSDTCPPTPDEVGQMESWSDIAARDGWEDVPETGLHAAAINGIAWALLEETMDTSDRQPSNEVHRAACETAGRILDSGCQRVHLVAAPEDGFDW